MLYLRTVTDEREQVVVVAGWPAGVPGPVLEPVTPQIGGDTAAGQVRGAAITHLASSPDVLPITLMRVLTAPWSDDSPDKSWSPPRTNSPPWPIHRRRGEAIISPENGSAEIGRGGERRRGTRRGAGRLEADVEGEIGSSARN